MTEIKAELPDVSLPLPLYESVRVGEMTGKDGSTFTLVIGLDRAAVERLKQKSLDETDVELMQKTSDRKRFGEGSYEDWYKKDRTPFAALDRQGDLAALVFCGPDTFPPELLEPADKELRWDTIAVRSYAPYRGSGLVSAFTAFAVDSYLRLRPDRSLWLVTDADNNALMHLASKNGFEKRGAREDGRVVMTRTRPDK